MKSEKISNNKGLKSPDEEDELKQFIKKKQIQNQALKKIVDKLNSNEANKKNK